MEELVPTLVRRTEAKMVLIVMDGLGGFRSSERGSELTEAKIPNLDQLAAEGSSGLLTMVAPGITPGSGAGHLALFGYDPIEYTLGRGALSAAGIGIELKPGEIAARANFCTVDAMGRVVDRRAGRITTEVNRRLCAQINAAVQLEEGVSALFYTERDHRAVLILKGDALSPMIRDTDPQILGLVPHDPAPLAEQAVRTADLVEKLLAQVRIILKDEPANFILLRGFDTQRGLPRFPERYGLRARGIASYPMYLGLAKIVGMETPPPVAGWIEAVEELHSSWDQYDFFYLHLKGTDAAGEDGDFERKCLEIERVDATIPAIRALNPEVICVTGDHSTPSQLMRHSWHPVPFILWGSQVGMDSVCYFNEEAARAGAFGHRMAKELMALILASSGRLITYGA
ncbi:MAG TPA: 2,3-bisphosphoglycerate-independent phosphoglycerate mutase [Actinomycetota bacterium]|jgi:2,3-bisphosphoglycerate-independent phosphoglycerate mutase|nr:2,3-bisphosphoglycerate-independent phosphoglycerate mutase [Actinomycetota bacterium]